MPAQRIYLVVGHMPAARPRMPRTEYRIGLRQGQDPLNATIALMAEHFEDMEGGPSRHLSPSFVTCDR